jgi:hypothetical protein
MVRLHQTIQNHSGNNSLALSTCQLSGAAASPTDDFVKLCYPRAPLFPFAWAPFNELILHLTAKCGGNIHCMSVPQFAASSVVKELHEIEVPLRNFVDLPNYSFFQSEDASNQ